MSEEKKKPVAKKLYVDTLHIHAKEIVLHQNTPDGQPEQEQNQGGFQQPPRDFWGFPVRQAQQPPQTQQRPQAQSATPAEEGNEKEQGEQQGEQTSNKDATSDGAGEQAQKQSEGQQGPSQGPPFGWI